ncbi:MAG: hypothetical protein M1818_001474 [Claussenomyces sp. TS43310]|nr:MAG: hypothetical protein M1818_001474 [Claussenomyces sp. TS43310]
MTTRRLSLRKRRVFDSVFEPVGQPQQPTPDIAFTQSGEPFGGCPFTIYHDPTQAPVSDLWHSHAVAITDAEDQVFYDRSWHHVTNFFTALNGMVAASIEQEASPLSEGSLPIPDLGFHQALKVILEAEAHLPLALYKDDLVAWYTQQVRFNFLHTVLPVLARIDSQSGPKDLLPATVRILEQAHHLYLYGISLIIKQLEKLDPSTSRLVIKNFRQDLHGMVSNTVTQHLLDSIKLLLAEKAAVILQVPQQDDLDGRTGSARREAHRKELLACVESLYNIGLAGEAFQIIFAEVMDDLMSSHVDHAYSGVWFAPQHRPHHQRVQRQISRGLEILASETADGARLLPRVVNHAVPSRCVIELCGWVENQYARLAVEVLNELDSAAIEWTDMEQWKEMGIGHFAALRTNELFDIVVEWPNSVGALDDLRAAVTTPRRRLQLTDVFSSKLKARLLHPGASTLQILRTYISMIWSFHSLDQSRVLLDRVAYPLQLYLCSREDTVKIIITGLLSDTEDVEGNPIDPRSDRLVELAVLLNTGSDQVGLRPQEDLDWSDMDWQPDPVDAGPGYKRTKSADVIGTLIGVLGSQDVFIKEFQNVIGENLLKHEEDFGKELKLLSLLKTRFGDSPLQNCEVMIRDILSSRPLNSIIRKRQNLAPSANEIHAARTAHRTLRQDHVTPEGLHKPSLHAKILSRLFWPHLHDGFYRIPPIIAELQGRYEKGFEELKNARVLTWLHALGQATVELDLLDRVVFEECQTWQATVIWAFHSDIESDKSPTRSVEELVRHLEMDETLVRSAINFWVGKMVLHEVQRDTYGVLETLNTEDRARSNAQAAAAAVAATESSVDEGALIGGGENDGAKNGIGEDKGEMYWAFIQGMLKNSAAQMPVQQIGMMLKMLIADGFPYGDEELREFLSAKAEKGLLEVKAGKYRLKK